MTLPAPLRSAQRLGLLWVAVAVSSLSCGVPSFEPPLLGAGAQAACNCPAGTTCGDGGAACVSTIPCARDAQCEVAPDACLIAPGSCAAGRCAYERRVACVGDVCTADAGCDDADPCNGVERCVMGRCVAGVPLVCDDRDPCTVDRCRPFLGCRATTVVDGTACSDGNACNGLEVCVGGRCTAGRPLSCDDGNGCTVDRCAPATGCEHAPLPDDTGCDDGDVCNGVNVCRAGRCVAGTPPVCNDGNPCTADSCDPRRGCQSAAVAEGTVCGAGDACTPASTCRSGVCRAPARVGCDDGNPCTVDSCGANGQCAHIALPNGTQCQVGDACTAAATCRAGVCVPGGIAATCDDRNPCTADSCDPRLGCRNQRLPDGTSCGAGRSCVTGRCRALSAIGASPLWRGCGVAEGPGAASWWLVLLACVAMWARLRRRGGR